MRDAPRPEEAVTLAVFRTGASLFAIDVAQVREVVRARSLMPLPKAPRLIEGVVDLRGAIVPVVDLARALGDEAVEASARPRIVVVEVDGLRMGLRVDAAVEVISVTPDELEDAPALAVRAGYEAVRAVVRRPDTEPVMLLSIESILGEVGRGSATRQEDAA